MSKHNQDLTFGPNGLEAIATVHKVVLNQIQQLIQLSYNLLQDVSVTSADECLNGVTPTEVPCLIYRGYLTFAEPVERGWRGKCIHLDNGFTDCSENYFGSKERALAAARLLVEDATDDLEFYPEYQ